MYNTILNGFKKGFEHCSYLRSKFSSVDGSYSKLRKDPNVHQDSLKIHHTSYNLSQKHMHPRQSIDHILHQ